MEDYVAQIRANLERVKARIEKTAISCGRAAKDVRLVVVTKGQPVQVTRAAIQAGAAILGENYPEEALPKIAELRNERPIEWHMIGHLQSRKARMVAEHFDMLHSLDSLRLAEKLERLLAAAQRTMPVLLEINVGGEESKYGWIADRVAQWDHLLPVIERVRSLPHLKIAGLMTMPPLFDDPQLSRPYFLRLRQLREFLTRQFPAEDFSELSMGTSADFETAIEEGSTIVRIGRAIVGPRTNYESSMITFRE